MKQTTFTALLSGWVDIIDLGNLFIGLLPSGITKVNMDVNTTRVSEVCSSGALGAKGSSQDKL